MSTNTITVAWDPPAFTGSSQLQGYWLSTPFILANYPANTLTATFSGVQPGYSGLFQVNAYNMELTSSWVDVTGTTTYFSGSAVYFKFVPYTTPSGGADVWVQFDPDNVDGVNWADATANNPRTYIVIGFTTGVMFNRINFTWDPAFLGTGGSYTNDQEPPSQWYSSGEVDQRWPVESANETTSLATDLGDPFLYYYVFQNPLGTGFWDVPEFNSFPTGTSFIRSMFSDLNYFFTGTDYESRRWIVLHGDFAGVEAPPVPMMTVTESIGPDMAFADVLSIAPSIGYNYQMTFTGTSVYQLDGYPLWTNSFSASNNNSTGHARMSYNAAGLWGIYNTFEGDGFWDGDDITAGVRPVWYWITKGYQGSTYKGAGALGSGTYADALPDWNPVVSFTNNLTGTAALSATLTSSTDYYIQTLIANAEGLKFGQLGQGGAPGSGISRVAHIVGYSSSIPGNSASFRQDFTSVTSVDGITFDSTDRLTTSSITQSLPFRILSSKDILVFMNIQGVLGVSDVQGLTNFAFRFNNSSASFFSMPFDTAATF